MTIQNLYESSAVVNLESAEPMPVIVVEESGKDDQTEVPINLPVSNEPIDITPTTPKTCYTGGCSGQICGDKSVQDIMTTCEWKEEYACYKEKTTCEVQSDGECGWTDSPEFQMCLNQSASVNDAELLQVL